jgi:hypothetical protein
MASAHLFRVIVPVSSIEEGTAFYSAILDQPGNRVSPGRHYFACGPVILACFDPRADGDPWDATIRTTFILRSTIWKNISGA